MTKVFRSPRNKIRQKLSKTKNKSPTGTPLLINVWIIITMTHYIITSFSCWKRVICSKWRSGLSDSKEASSSVEFFGFECGAWVKFGTVGWASSFASKCRIVFIWRFHGRPRRLSDQINTYSSSSCSAVVGGTDFEVNQCCCSTRPEQEEATWVGGGRGRRWYPPCPDVAAIQAIRASNQSDRGFQTGRIARTGPTSCPDAVTSSWYDSWWRHRSLSLPSNSHCSPSLYFFLSLLNSIRCHCCSVLTYKAIFFLLLGFGCYSSQF